MAKTYNPQGRDGNTSTKLPRNSDRVYECGFDPNGRSLTDCRAHWLVCDNERCDERLQQDIRLVEYLKHKYGDGTLPPDHR